MFVAVHRAPRSRFLASFILLFSHRLVQSMFWLFLFCYLHHLSTRAFLDFQACSPTFIINLQFLLYYCFICLSDISDVDFVLLHRIASSCVTLVVFLFIPLVPFLCSSSWFYFMYNAWHFFNVLFLLYISCSAQASGTCYVLGRLHRIRSPICRPLAEADGQFMHIMVASHTNPSVVN